MLLYTRFFNSSVAIAFILAVPGCLNAFPDNISRAEYTAIYKRAETLASQRHWAAAQPLLLQLARSPYADKVVFSWLADSFMTDLESGARDYKSADIALDQALQRDPNWGTAWRQKASLANYREDPRQAIIMASRAISCKEPDLSGFYQRAQAYAALKDYNHALADDNEYLKTRKNRSPGGKVPEEIILKGAILEHLGRYDEAIAVYKSFLSSNFESATASIVRCLRNQNKFDEAIKQVSLLIAKNPTDDQAFYQRACLKSQKKDWTGALSDFSKAIDLSAVSNYSVSRYYLERARVYDAINKPQEAAADRKKSQDAVF